MNRIAAIAFLITSTLIMSGCVGQPRMRMGCLPTSTPGGTFLKPDSLGKHSYGPGGAFKEKNGIVYTCKAGHIDITHFRWNADYTKYLTEKTNKALMNDKEKISFNIIMEQSEHVVKFCYPDSWKNMEHSKKLAAADEIAFNLGPYLAFTATAWHEIATAYGTHYAGIEPEENSAFSWEDTFSNLLGCHIGAAALQDKKHSFNEAVTILLEQKLNELGAVSKEQAIELTERMRYDWFEGNFAVEVKMKNFDIGFDGSITPTVVTKVLGCPQDTVKYETFSTDILDKYGITMTYEIIPNIFEAGKIYKAAGHEDIFPKRDFPAIIEDLKQKAKEKGWKWDE